MRVGLSSGRTPNVILSCLDSDDAAKQIRQGDGKGEARTARWQQRDRGVGSAHLLPDESFTRELRTVPQKALSVCPCKVCLEHK